MPSGWPWVIAAIWHAMSHASPGVAKKKPIGAARITAAHLLEPFAGSVTVPFPPAHGYACVAGRHLAVQRLLADQPAIRLRLRCRELGAGLGPRDALRVRTDARIRSSTVSNLIWVSSVNRAGLTGPVTPAELNRRRISAQLMNSTGRPRASPTAPASMQPLICSRRSTPIK